MDRATRILNAKADRAAWTRRQFVAGMGAGAIVAAGMRVRKASALLGIPGGAASGAFSGFYPAGHWVTPPFPFNTSNPVANLIYPRPDAETSTYAPHRCLFYDGTHQMANYIPLCIRGGAFPYVFEQVNAPPGTTLLAGVWQPNWTIADAVAAGYGVVHCIPTAPFSGATFQYRVTDQTGATFLITWTGSTYGTWSSSTNLGFGFLDPVNGVDPSSYSTVPSITSPCKTLNWACGATYHSTSYPGMILVLRAGTIPMFPQDAAAGITLDATYTPIALIGYPGESVILDATNAGSSYGWQLQQNDCVLRNFTETNGPSSSANFNHFINGASTQRFLADGISFPNVFLGTAPTNNGGPILFGSTAAQEPYTWLRNLSTVAGAATILHTNGFVGVTFFTRQYAGVELSSFTGTVVQSGVDFKASVSDATVRTSQFIMSSSATYPLLAYDQYNSFPSDNQEFCYNIIDTTAAGYGAAITMNQLGTSSNNVGTTASYRNSLVGYGLVGGPTGNGPFSFANDAIQYGTGNSPVEIVGGGSLPPNVTNTGTTSQAATGIFTNPGAGDYSLVNSARTGLDGATIA